MNMETKHHYKRCFYCGKYLDENGYKDYLKHRDTLNYEYVWYCKSCKNTKSDKSIEEYRQYLEVLFNQLKNNSVYSILFNLNILVRSNSQIFFYGESKDKTSDILLIKLNLMKYFNITEEQLESKSHKIELVWPRQVIQFFCKKNTNNSLNEIGWFIGKKDHATVLHSIHRVNNAIETNRTSRKEITKISDFYNLRM